MNKILILLLTLFLIFPAAAEVCAAEIPQEECSVFASPAEGDTGRIPDEIIFSPLIGAHVSATFEEAQVPSPSPAEEPSVSALNNEAPDSLPEP